MDKIYVGDIPSEYCYAIFHDNYIDLYKQMNIQGSLDFYRVYLYNNLFEYEHKYEIYDNTNDEIATYVSTTDNYLYRQDMPDIMFMSIVYVLIIVVLLNLVTSCFKKGGVFSGLL